MLRNSLSYSHNLSSPPDKLVVPDKSCRVLVQAPVTFVAPQTVPRPSPCVTAKAPSPLVQKLRSIGHLEAEEVRALEALSRDARLVGPEQVLIHEGSQSNDILLIVDGLGCRYKMLAGGRRQILGYLIPGDLCDLQYLVARSDYGVCTLGKSLVARIPTSKIAGLMMRYPAVGGALTRSSLIDAVVLRQWLLNIGQRDAFQKMCHLFCEMALRLELVGRTNNDGSFEVPLNQVTLADTLGISLNHVNRTLQRLRAEGLVRFCNRRLMILEWSRLAAIAEFDGAYLRFGLEAGCVRLLERR